MISEIYVEGYLGNNADQKFTQGGLSVVKFSMGTTEKIKDRQETQWHSVIVWGKYGEAILAQLKKGTHVIVRGTLKYNLWEKDGHKHKDAQIHAQNVRVIAQRERQDSPADNTQESQSSFTEDDIPL